MLKSLYLRAKQYVDDVLVWANTREPVVVISGVAGAVATFVAEHQGELQGVHAWIAVVWAGVTWVMRHHVSPAAKASK